MAARRFVLPGVWGRDTVPGVPARRADHSAAAPGRSHW
ncbi:hypothetical protein MUK42_30586 [Musa troglodytarum]|uniref:Uncharacterized protein n=1 Tax=Musa troglodytarum TaxID=320322 RepID=A0A9E7JVK9_9LILI|nr:hypothetical protein MUK42_30586 [Musa troglodytarum]